MARYVGRIAYTLSRDDEISSSHRASESLERRANLPIIDRRARTLPRSMFCCPASSTFLGHDKRVNGITSEALDHVHRRARSFFVYDGRVWRRSTQGRHQLVLQHPQQRPSVTRDLHDKLGNKRLYSTLHALLDRFWWPSLAHDVGWYFRICHESQICQTTKMRIPATVAAPAPLFHKAYVDTMFMPRAVGYQYIIQAQLRHRSVACNCEPS
jgi:hypothetical protein